MIAVQSAMQPNMHAHDDLATLFSRNMTFNPQVQESTHQNIPRQEPQPASIPAQPIVYSISQHYHHSAHAVKQPAQQTAAPEEPQRRSSAPPPTDAVSSETILRNHGVNPTNLTPSQVQLFRIADDPQKLRLLELWSIYPPNNGADIPALAWSSTTMEQEEQLAQMRFDRQQQSQTMSLDGTPVQTGDGRWHQYPDSEPYVISGYEELMRRDQARIDSERQARGPVKMVGYSSATDPVYMGPEYSRLHQQQMVMATQYGAFEQNRGSDDMDMM
jgi:hypothetical protein